MFWVSDFGFRISDFGFRVSGFGFRVSGYGLRISGFGFRVSGFGLRISGFGLRGAAVYRENEAQKLDHQRPPAQEALDHEPRQDHLHESLLITRPA